MTIAKWGLALILGLFLIAFGLMKFTGAHIFQFIEANAAAKALPFAGLFHPLLNGLVGVAELGAGLLIVAPLFLSGPLGAEMANRLRVLGGLLGLGVIGGAIVFHLSPYLGVNTPGGFSAQSDGAPWTYADFTEERAPVLFIMAVVMAGVAAANLWVTLRKPA